MKFLAFPALYMSSFQKLCASELHTSFNTRFSNQGVQRIRFRDLHIFVIYTTLIRRTNMTLIPSNLVDVCTYLHPGLLST